MVFIIKSNAILDITNVSHAQSTLYYMYLYYKFDLQPIYQTLYSIARNSYVFAIPPPPLPPKELHDAITSCYSPLFIQQRLNGLQFRTQTACPKLTFSVKCHSTVCIPQWEHGSSTMRVQMHKHYPNSKKCYSLSLPPVVVLEKVCYGPWAEDVATSATRHVLLSFGWRGSKLARLPQCEGCSTCEYYIKQHIKHRAKGQYMMKDANCWGSIYLHNVKRRPRTMRVLRKHTNMFEATFNYV